ncbi:AMP-binding protein [Heyndrickxia vini]|uniref:Acyl--CoA ligase n=1 Tax=Heyndrickxia vini TaxID=1476025 RepID=A0ABX7E4Q5_9BACI|nr:class I adenylate-forming enzyme family protein [Heyndrickxia vini]QQZ10280.1 acyl--CoA ligase [Heyndrickxia vini]
MDKKFLVHRNKEYTYENFLNDLNLKNEYSSYLYVKNNNPYAIFVSLVHSAIYGYSIEIIDGDLSEKEIEEIGIDQNEFSVVKKLNSLILFKDFEQLLDILKEKKRSYITLYTSGTSGRPKKVSHTLETLTREVKVSGKFKENIWSFSFNPTHMAGLQVFFQAFLNKNTIIYTFDELPKNIPTLIEKYKITNISATSTFYRNILPYFQQGRYFSVERITFGGEKYDQGLEESIKKVFPNAKINNIYASTEAGSLFKAYGDIFEIKESIRKFVKINENNELLIHYSLLGKSESFNLKGEWFNTEDIVELVDTNHFKFVARKSELINVGGYKVNPLEVENTIKKVPGVIDIIIKTRKNSVTGQIIIAEIIKNDGFNDLELKKSIKKFALTHLQEWKVPRIINFVNEISQTRTGKKARK